MGRLVWYAGVSTGLAGSVIFSAFHQRANFYSACVYLSQSNLCLMILINLILFIYCSFMYGLQRLCFGPLRPIEIEQLYEKSWFAVTETCLAMTIFREEVGAWFLVMFISLLTGKVWGWIGDGRVEILEQQPPANPRLFHIRLTVSLALSIIYDTWLMSYAVNTVIQQARPNMMVMFLFEFAVLSTSSLSTACRYAISLIEASIVKTQTRDRLIERKAEVREERAQMERQRAAAQAAGEEVSTAPLPSEDDIEEMDIEVPGWEAKGQWVLSLDLITDFMKLGIYSAFFFILLTFYGLPIHIMRDLFMTARSFIKRLTAFLRYRRATHDMNQKYEDATVEDISREDTCIICREEMRPWSVTNPQVPPAAQGNGPAAARRPTTINERSRPKKLPCGHILHLGCLKSWLERQQVCPTCRRPVVDNNPPARGGDNGNRPEQGGQPPAPGHENGGARDAAPGQGRGLRMLNLGPLRVGFGAGNLEDLAQGLGAPPNAQQNAGGGNARVYGLELGFPRRQQAPPQGQETPQYADGQRTIQEDLHQIEQRIAQEIRGLQLTQQQLQVTNYLQAELNRLRAPEADPAAPSPLSRPVFPPSNIFNNRGPVFPPGPSSFTVNPQIQRHTVRAGTNAIPSGSSQLPPGVTIPDGWSLLPLQRLEAATVSQPAASNLSAGSGPVAVRSTASSPGPPSSAGSLAVPTPTPTVSADSIAAVTATSANTRFTTTQLPISSTASLGQTTDQSTSRLFAHTQHRPRSRDPSPGPQFPSSESLAPIARPLPSETTPASGTVATPEIPSLPSQSSANTHPPTVLQSGAHFGTIRTDPKSESDSESESDESEPEKIVKKPVVSDSEESSSESDSEPSERTDKGKAKAVTLEDVEDEEA